MDFSTLPMAVSPSFTTPEMNSPVRVSETGLLLKIGDDERQPFDGAISYVWLPDPHFELSGWCHWPGGIENRKVTVRVPGAASDAAVSIVRAGVFPGRDEIAGRIDPVEVGSWDSIDEIRYHLGRFPKFMGRAVVSGTTGLSGRMPLETDDWVGCLDEIVESDRLAHEHEKTGGGYLSHVGRFTRRDGGLVERSAAAELFEILHFFFAFLADARCGPVFLEGWSGGERRWQYWRDARVSAERVRGHWLPQRRPCPDLSQILRSFCRNWRDTNWRHTVKYAIGWLLEANRHGLALEAVVPLAQIALEMLAWLVIVEKKAKLRADDFGRITAEGRIRLLLTEHGIRTDPAAHLPELAALCKQLHTDALGTFVRTRNALVHEGGRPKGVLSQLTNIQLFQVASMSITFLELALLALVEYQGIYTRRGGTTGWADDAVESVPWASAGTETTAP